VLVALAGGAYTWLLWGHPYAMLIFGVEALVVGWVLRRTGHLALADALYWLLAGGPLVALFYGGVMGLDGDTTSMVMFKQMVNGILNALLASFVVQGIRAVRPGAVGDQVAGLSIRRLTFDALLAVGLVAGITSMVVNSYNARNDSHQEAGKELGAVAQRLVRQLEREGGLPQAALDAVALDDDVNWALYSAQGQLLAGRGVLRGAKPGSRVSLDEIYPGLAVWLPEGKMALVARWRQGYYMLDLRAVGRDGMTVHLEQAAAPSVIRIERSRLRLLTLMSGVALLSVLVAWLLSRWLTRPLLQLEALSRALPARVTQGQFEPIEGSRIDEFDSLRRSLQAMADSMAANFGELRQMRDSLEQQVRERTAVLVQREQALEEFKATLDHTLDSVFMFDAQNHEFFYVNQGALKLLGYEREELLGLHLFDLVPDMTAEVFRAQMAPLLYGECATMTYETGLRNKQGSVLSVEVFLQYLAIQGQAPRFVAIARDITERKRVERMKSEFVSTVSHELRTPLTSITGALGLVVGGALGEVAPQVRQMLDLANKNSQRLAHLINDLLDMEKLAAGKMQFDMRDQPLMPLVEHALESTRAYATQHQVQFVLNERLDGAQANVDGGRLQQVLTNFLSNAAKFSPAGAQVEVRVNGQPGGRVRVEVRDHGPGIPAQFRDRIFQKFSQADSSDTRQKGGTGLGLAISKELIERMRGSVGFESEEGRGSCFYFELALTASSSAA
jgi:PAS domain S-box-containing protein